MTSYVTKAQAAKYRGLLERINGGPATVGVSHTVVVTPADLPRRFMASILALPQRYCAYCDAEFAAMNCPECERPLR